MDHTVNGPNSNHCLVHEKNFDPITKLTYLVAHLTPNSEPYNFVDGFTKTAAGYEAAWKSLCSTYSNENRVVSSIISRFLDMTPLKQQPSRTDIMNLVTSTLQLTMALDSYQIDVSTWDSIVRKLDNHTKSKWSAANITPTLPTLEMFTDFLKGRAAQVHDATNKPTNTTNNKPTNNNNNNKTQLNAKFTKAANVQKPNKCLLCPQNHFLYQCSVFRRMTAQERLLVVNNGKMCIRCLRSGCVIANCPVGACSCGQLHNRMLCQTHADRQTQPSQAVALPATEQTTTKRKAKPPSDV